jgi:isopenicillin N synthase-like dioxygenase
MLTTYLDKVCEVAKHFFALPVKEKQKYARDVNEYEGYGNDVIFSEKQVHDWSYRLALPVFPDEKRRLFLRLALILVSQLNTNLQLDIIVDHE